MKKAESEMTPPFLVISSDLCAEVRRPDEHGSEKFCFL